MATPTKAYMFLNNLGQEPLLMFPNKGVDFEVKMIKNDDSSKIDLMAEVSKRIAGIIGYFGIMIASLIGFSVFTGSDSGSAVKMLRLFKVIYR